MYTIFIHGVLADKGDEPDDVQIYTIQDLALALNAAKNESELILDINSVGGYNHVAKQMYDLLVKSGKMIKTRNSGIVASAATTLFMIPELQDRVFNPTLGEFLVHNPWTIAEGDSAYMAEMSKELEQVEKEYISFYSKKTGVEASVIKTFMSQNIALTPEQIETLRFATLVKEPIKIVAKFKSNTNIKSMQENEELKKSLTGIESIMAKLKLGVDKLLGIKSLMVNDASGNELTFPEINEVSEITAGVTVTVGGTPATGTYTMPDGSQVVCENGKVTSVVPAAQESEEMKALKAENEKLKAEIAASQAKAEESKASVEGFKAQLKEVNESLEKIKGQFSSGKPNSANTPPSSGGNVGFSFKKK
jgi:ATP-dependent Clp protease protease subunit